MSENNETEQLIELDFIHLGVRVDGRKKRADFKVIQQDGTLSGTFSLPITKGFSMVSGRLIGGVYSCMFTPDLSKINGFMDAKFKYKWNGDPALVMKWEAKDTASRLQEKQSRLESDEKRVSELERTLKPIQQLYYDMASRGDYLGSEALAQAVLAIVRRKPRK